MPLMEVTGFAEALAFWAQAASDLRAIVSAAPVCQPAPVHDSQQGL